MQNKNNPMTLSDQSRQKWQRSMTLRKKGALPEAERELKAALEEQPDHPLLNASLAQLYLKQKRFYEARILVESILSQKPEYPQALYVLGEIYLNEDKPDDALRSFHQAYQKDQSPYLAHSIVKTLRKTEQYDAALEMIDSTLITNRDNLRLLKEKALILNRLQRSDEALRTYEHIKELDPNDPYVSRAIYHLKSLNRPDHEVIQELKKVLSLPSRKDNAQLHELLAEKLKKAGRLKEAAAEYRKAYELAPDNIFFLKQEGFCQYKLKDYSKAIRLLSNAFRRDPTDFIVRRTLKTIYSQTNNMDGFIHLLEEALKEHPHNVKLMGTLKGLKKKSPEKW
jgi:tetratricopeptide (TPR) repeat protein